MDSHLDPIAHHNLAVIETADRATMESLRAEPSFRGVVWIELTPTRPLVDPQAVPDVVETLRKQGIAPTYSTNLTAE